MSFPLVSIGVRNIFNMAPILELHNIQTQPSGQSGIGFFRSSFIGLKIASLPSHLIIEKTDTNLFVINVDRQTLKDFHGEE